MAVVAMKRLELWASKKCRKPLLELLQQRGAVEVHPSQQAEALFGKMDTSQKLQEFEQATRLLEQAASLLDQYAPPKKGLLSSLAGRPEISPAQYQNAADSAPGFLKAAEHLQTLGKRLTDGEAQLLRLEAQKESLKPWISLDLPLDYRGTEHTRALIGSFPEDLDEGTLKNLLASKLPEVEGIEVEILSRQAQMTCVFLLCLKHQAPQVEAALRSLGFSYPAASGGLPPAQQAKELDASMAAQKEAMEQVKQEIQSRASQRDGLLLAADYYSARAEKYKVLGELWQSPHAFCVTGYIPAENAPALQKELESSFSAYVLLSDPDPDEETPVKLKNGFFTAPMESVVAGYSLPGKHEVDPSSVMAFFYYVLFGMMLSDAAYGLLIVLGCGGALAKFKHMEEGMRKSLRMFFFCGISTMFWGVLFGSYFGDCISVISRTFFHTEITVPALWFEPLDDPMRLLLFSFAVGIAHLFTGLGVQLYQLLRQKKFTDALYDVVFWYLLVGGLIVLLLSTEMFCSMVSLPFRFPGIVGSVAAVLAGIGAVGIVCTAGRESRSPVKRLLKGLYGLYNISGYLSDILSYSRLLALGLATGVIASVFNQMGSMLGDGVVGAIFFAVVFVIGHGMNLAINVLGAYVHTNRLQYVEFFGKFYEGGGRAFQPFATHTRHYQIKEEK